MTLSSGDVFSVDGAWFSMESNPAAFQVKPSAKSDGEFVSHREGEIIEAALAATKC